MRAGGSISLIFVIFSVVCLHSIGCTDVSVHVKCFGRASIIKVYKGNKVDLWDLLDFDICGFD